MTIAWMPATAGWEGPDDEIRWADLALADFLDVVAEHGLRSPDERAFLDLVRRMPDSVPVERVADAAPPAEIVRATATASRIRGARLDAFTERQTRLAERLLGITEEDR